VTEHAGVIKDYTNVYVVCALVHLEKKKLQKQGLCSRFSVHFRKSKKERRREYFSKKEEPQPMVNL